MSTFIEPIPFLISLSIGLLITYLLLPTPKVITRYPNLDNAGKITYVDNVGKCYKYKKEEVDCKLQNAS